MIQHIDSQSMLPLIQESMEKDTPFTFNIKGTSMRPFLPNNATVTLTPATTLNKYEVYLFIHNNQVKLHRLIKHKHNTFFFLGDALKTYEQVSKDNIIAHVSHLSINDKPIQIKSRLYKFEVRLWHHLRLFRRPLLKLKSIFSK